MSAIEFVVRGSTGAMQRGSVAGDGAASALAVQAGSDVSLNLSRAQIVSYMRQGNALHITLIDGRVIVVEGFFGADGQPIANLFISSNGVLHEVQLVEGGAGLYYSNYIQADSSGKYSAFDSLIFDRGSEVMLASGPAAQDDDVGMLAGGLALPGMLGLPLLGLLGLGAGAAALGSGDDKPKDVLDDDEEREPGDDDDGTGGGGDGGNDDDDDGTGGGGDDDTGGGGGGGGGGGDLELEVLTGTVNKGHVVNAEDRADGVEITGTGTPGGTVTVVVEGSTQTTVVDQDGNWSVTFPPGQIPEGTYVTPVEATIVKGDQSLTVTETLSVDTEAMVTFDAHKVGGDGVVNAVEANGGIQLTGKTEVGSSVTVVVEGVSYIAIVTGTNWSVTIPSGSITRGEYSVTAQVSAVDQYGNTGSTSGTYVIDTQTFVTVRTHDVAGDGVINFVERLDGVTITGTAEAGASVVVYFGSAIRTTTASSSGQWSVSYGRNDIPLGESIANVTAVATDAAGNAATAFGTVGIDTLVDPLAITSGPVGGDGVVNFTESQQTITVTGIVEIGSTVLVSLAGVTVTASVTASGNWTAIFPPGSLPGGEYNTTVTVTATDLAGNTGTTMQNVRIDTMVNPFTLNTPVEGDDIINAAEASDGVQLSGTVEAFSQVVVQFGGVTRSVTAGANGIWQLTIPSSAVQAAEYNDTITATATDINGNVSVLTHGVRIDTIVNRLDMTRPVEGDNIVNRAEASDGITLAGTVEAGSTVVVTFAGVSRTATVDAAGNWTVDFAAHEIPHGEYTASVTIRATDWVGNTRAITETFLVDTAPPEAPMIESATRERGGLRSFSSAVSDDPIEVVQINGDGTVSSVNYQTWINPVRGEMNFEFTGAIPNGSHLVITSTDASGNNTSTLFLLEETLTNAINVTNPGLSAFNIEGIDLQFAEDSQLTLTVADLEALAAHSNLLTIHGGTDDTVTALGAVKTGETREMSGRSYEVYSFGDNGGTLIIEDLINVVT
jgi:hypothetical protein